MKNEQIYTLNPAECIYAPLQDDIVRQQLDYSLESIHASDCRLTETWANVCISWGAAEPESHAVDFVLRHEVSCARFDRLLAALTMPEWITVDVAVTEDGQHWTPLEGSERGRNSRSELSCPLPVESFKATRLRFHAHESHKTEIRLTWLGLAESAFHRELESRKPTWNHRWEGFILPPEEWGTIRFKRGLFFNEDDLTSIRRRITLPDWQEHWSVLEKKARRAMERIPEDDIGEYIPWSDQRFSRAREFDREPYYLQGPLLGFVGLVTEDKEMMFHALRFLMSMAHCDHWCQSKESDLNGTAWDQRCFIEELTASSVAMLWDWLSFALTYRAHHYLARVLWRRGLAVIEGDIMHYEYLYHMNQGPWFCRARVLGGLLLEAQWDRMGGYVDRAVDDLLEGLNNYILEDGGTDEGSGYMSLTLHMTLPALMAYAKVRDRPVEDLLPRNLHKAPSFLAGTSRVTPGRYLMDGDSSTDYLIGDTVALLRKLLGDPLLDGMLPGTLTREMPFTYFHHYVQDGLLTLVHGPDELPNAACVVPEFAIFEQTGHLTSLRKGPDFSVRLHFVGCKANPSHSHLDKGNLTLEVDEKPMLIDRGTVRYDNPNCAIMQSTEWGNVISLVVDGTTCGQARPSTAVIPAGNGDAQSLSARIDLTDPWQNHMHQCSRAIESTTVDQFFVTDRGVLKKPGFVVFNLQANAPFQTGAQQAVLEIEGHRVEIEAPWAESITQAEEGIDYRFQPVFRLQIRSPLCESFDFRTEFRILH